MARYNDFDFCDQTKGVDNLLYRYQEDREEVMSLAFSNPLELVEFLWKDQSLLCRDEECKCNLRDAKTFFSCSQCKNILKLVDVKKGTVDRPFVIQCGGLTGKTLIVKSFQVGDVYLKEDTCALSRVSFYKKQYSKLEQCGTPEVKLCVSGDPFTVETLVSWAVERLLKESGLPHVDKLYTSFVCGAAGFQLKEHTESVEPDFFTPGVVKSVLKQLVAVLKKLSEISFSHGNPVSLKFVNEPVSYLFDGVVISGPLTLRLTNFSKSSVTLNGTHFFSEDFKTELCASTNMFTPEMFKEQVVSAFCSATPDSSCRTEVPVVYRLTSRGAEVLRAVRHLGFPLYAGSFDFYSFLLSLMLKKGFRQTVLSDTELHKFWSKLWSEQDLLEVERQLETETSPLKVMLRKTLRCDALEHAWNLIKTEW